MKTSSDPSPATQRQPAAQLTPAVEAPIGVGFAGPGQVLLRKVREISAASPQVRQLRDLHGLIHRSWRTGGATGASARLVQRYPTAMNDESAKAFSTLYSTAHAGKEDDAFTGEELAEIKSGVFMLTPLHSSDIEANCIGWAMGIDGFEDPGNMYLWEHEHGYTRTAADAGDAQIILWGTKNDAVPTNTSKWDIRHASVLLTHAEIVARSKRFNGMTTIGAGALSAAGISDPCWTSAGGMGFGMFVHPRNWFEGGDFGTALAGMRK